MEPFSFGASIIAVVQVSDRVISVCKRLLAAARDAPADIRLILIEISTLRGVLDSLHFLSSCSHGLTALDNLVGDDGPIEGCRRAIQELEVLLETSTVTDSQSKTKAVLAVVSWTMKEAKARKLLEQLRQYKSTIDLALATESTRDVKDLKRKANKIHATLTDMQRRDVYDWLHSTDPSTLHHKSCKLYEPGTGEWLFRSPVWTSWLEEKTRCIWIHGIPGAGKTIFASHLIETVKMYCAAAQKDCAWPRITCVYYYCYFGHGQDEAIPFLKWVLSQLCRQLDRVPESLHQLYRLGGEPSLSSLLDVLEELMEDFDKVYIFLDAVDESMPREDLLRVLRDFATDSRFDKLRILATSREYIDIETVMMDISAPISMRNPLLDQDIAIFVQSQLAKHPKLSRWPVETRTQAMEALAAKAKGMFRWVVCQIDALRRLKPDSNVIETALANLPKTLDETYERIFLNIPEDARLFVKHALQWLQTHQNVHRGAKTSAIPCSVLLQAVQKTLAADESYDMAGYVFDEDLLREFCGCLITLTADEEGIGAEENLLMVSFAHYTVVEFLQATRIRCGPAAPFALRLPLNIQCVETLFLATVGPEGEEAWVSLRQGYDLSNIDPEAKMFAWYCLDSSLVLLYKHSSTLCLSEYATLTDLVFRLLRELKRRFQSLPEVQLGLGTYVDRDANLIIDTFNRASKTSFVSQPARSVDVEAYIYSLQIDATGALGRHFLKSLGDPQGIMSCRLDLEFELYDNAFFTDESSREIVVGFPGPKRWRFQGSPMEFIVHMPCYEHFVGLTDAISTAAGYFDPSVIMLLFIGRNAHPGHGLSAEERCSSCLSLKRLLQLGAKPTAPGYAVGSLQIAVAMKYFVGVRLLLEAGADPNDVGDLSGAIGTPDRGAMLKWFERVRGKSPLNILRNGPFALRRDRTYLAPEPDALAKIEALLLEHGARDFVISEDGYISTTTSMSVNGSGQGGN
ncbi:NACHT domain-containing protein [Madurella fahalii]|uniref:NACHT domain-containing protein n=1 Tax=Madurella fahalii TaxID=1157608 RepID=A0ABQ0FYN5_9PEZI